VPRDHALTRATHAVALAVIVAALNGCGPSPSFPTGAPSTAPSAGQPATEPVTPSAVPSATPSLTDGPAVTLAILNASLAYAICSDGQCDVHYVDTAGVDRNVTNTPEVGTEEHQPVFSPDGTRVVFRCTNGPAPNSADNSNDDLCIAGVDGSNRRNLTDNDVADYSSSWSPDGRWISFASGRGASANNPGDIYVMNPTGGDVRRVTTSVGIDEYPTWSPDGTTIAYACTSGRVHPSRVGDFEVCLVNSDGTDRLRITDTPGICAPTGWSPDGATLAYLCDPDGNGPAANDVYLGTGDATTRLTTTGGFGAKFTPDGMAVIYKDGDGQLFLLTLAGVRSPIDAPHIEADWDVHFARRS
jgi:Tol biopolymer transport system component